MIEARDVMTSPVVALRPDTPVPAAAELLCSRGFTAAPVVDGDGCLVGIATEIDLTRSPVVPDWWRVQREPDPTVQEVMTRDPVTMRPQDDLAAVVHLMLGSGIRSVPIVDDDGELVGIVTRQDVLRAVARREFVLGDRTVLRYGRDDLR